MTLPRRAGFGMTRRCLKRTLCSRFWPTAGRPRLMSESIKHNFPFYFPIFFVLMWLFVTTLLGFISGWYALMRRYPDNSERPLHTFARQSGSMNSVGMRSVLNLSVCDSGLRVGIMRVFGIFSRNFFVPWHEITVSRRDRFLRKVAKLSFGAQASGDLTIPSDIADRIARAAGSRWPEPGAFPMETNSKAWSRILKQWLVSTGMAAAFFIIVPRFGVVGVVQYFRRAQD
jgi:hypothetical protein